MSKRSQLCGRRFRPSNFVIPSDFVHPPQYCYGGRVIRHSDLRSVVHGEPAATKYPQWEISGPRRPPSFLRTKVRAPCARAAITLNRNQATATLIASLCADQSRSADWTNGRRRLEQIWAAIQRKAEERSEGEISGVSHFFLVLLGGREVNEDWLGGANGARVPLLCRRHVAL